MAAAEKIRVFLVDDVMELRVLLRQVLEEDPEIEVVGEAATGHEGVAGAAEARPDVVLLDLSMPDMDGLEAIPLLREQAPDARIVVLSGHEAGRVSLEALGQGATRYLNKVVGFNAIRQAVHEVAQLKPPFTDERFGIVRKMWTAYLKGAIDEMLEEAHPDAKWRPYLGVGRELRSQEVPAFIEELQAEGRIPDPRAYGVEPRGNGLIVMGTLEFRRPEGPSETEIYWVFCFRGTMICFTGGYEGHQQAVQTIEERCPA
jgi:DNA-binding NarL/FixJ family response regulator